MAAEEDEVVTAWRVVKRRMAKEAAGETRDATVYASRVGRGTPRGGRGEGGRDGSGDESRTKPK